MKAAADMERMVPAAQTIPSILDRLKSPTPSAVNRKRKVHVNPPPTGKRRARGEGASEPKSVRPSQRVSEFSKEHLTVSNSKLFCTTCREEGGDSQPYFLHQA